MLWGSELTGQRYATERTRRATKLPASGESFLTS